MSSVVSIEEYREVLDDHESTDEQILRRLAYLEALCRNIARAEIETYVHKAKSRDTDPN